jgi:hypothetical protein
MMATMRGRNMLWDQCNKEWTQNKLRTVVFVWLCNIYVRLQTFLRQLTGKRKVYGHFQQECSVAWTFKPLLTTEIILLCTKKTVSNLWFSIRPDNSVPLTSCTPTKCNLYVDSTFDTVTSQRVLYKLLIFCVPNLVSIFHHLSNLSKESIKVWSSSKLFIRCLFFLQCCKPHAKPPSWRTAHRRLSADAYSMYLQLLTIAGGYPTIHNLRTCHTVVTRDPPNMDYMYYS